jgi:hypothetical protein
VANDNQQEYEMRKTCMQPEYAFCEINDWSNACVVPQK